MIDSGADADLSAVPRCSTFCDFAVPKGGLEPPRAIAHCAPERSASTSSTTSAKEQKVSEPLGKVNAATCVRCSTLPARMRRSYSLFDR